MNTLKPILMLLGLVVTGSAWGKVNVLTCEPEWAALAQRIGGDEVSANSATNGRQDPHHVQARPSLIAKARRAELLICTGAELEIGWLPLLLRKSANPRIQNGQPGQLIATRFVQLRGVPLVADRAAGDIHSQGNPHIQTDPRNLPPVARAIAQRLAIIDPGKATYFEQRLAQFEEAWRQSIEHWNRQAAPLRGKSVISFHDNWPYLEDWLGLSQRGTLEPKPGIPPTSRHLTQLLASLKLQPADMIIYAAYQDPKPAEWLAARSGLVAVRLPFTVGGTEQADTLEGLYADTFRRLLDALR